VAEEIVGLAEELGVDLIVVGSRCLSRVRRALTGSVSDAVVCNAGCPVLVVRVGQSRFQEHGRTHPLGREVVRPASLFLPTK
jgi:hypothetical protein